jgi:hypothetical protein
MGTYASRYLFIIYPLFNMVFIYFFYKILNYIFSKKIYLNRGMLLVIVACILILTNIFNSSIYLWKNNYNVSTIKEMLNGSDVVIVSSDNWLLTTYAPLAYNANQVLFTTYSYFSGLDSNISDSKSNDLYLLLDTTYLSYDDNTSESYTIQSSYEFDTLYDIQHDAMKKGLDITSDTLNKDEYLEKIKSLFNVSNIEYIDYMENFSKKIELYKLY